MNRPAKMLAEDDVKQIFMQCRNTSHTGIYPADPLDIIEFADKVEQVILARLRGKQWPDNFEIIQGGKNDAV